MQHDRKLDLLSTVRTYFPAEYQHAIDHAGTQARVDDYLSNARRV